MNWHMVGYLLLAWLVMDVVLIALYMRWAVLTEERRLQDAERRWRP